MKSRIVLVLVMIFVCRALPVFCQTETATISGRVTDPSGAAISGADIQIQNILNGRETATKTNSNGLYVVTALQPGTYRLIVTNIGFKQIVKPNVVLNVQDNASVNFSMTIGSVSETITVDAGAPIVNTQDATVSTVVDRQFAENLPLNGRSFQSLIELTPGVVITPTTQLDPGQFSVNGQRSSSNNFMVDGVSANIGAGTAQASAGTVAGFGLLGGTNSLVSVDALQEFRIQTSTYAPEFGRSPGAQISIETRSGTNAFHGTLFDYVRNDIFDANDWFNGVNILNPSPLPKAKERQNDFGGVLGGPIIKNRTFFFFSYEGFRLRLPLTDDTTVPDVPSRQSAPSAIQPFLNAYPLPNGPEILDQNGNPTSTAAFNASFSEPATINAASIRIDHKWNDNLSLFARYSDSPSNVTVRGDTVGIVSLNTTTAQTLRTQTVTLGARWSPTAFVVNDFRVNYSKNTSSSSNGLDTFGGAIVPPESILFPSPFSTANSNYIFYVASLRGGEWQTGNTGENIQRQINLVDSLSFQKGRHTVTLGYDYRRLSPIYRPSVYGLNPQFLDVPSVVAGTPYDVFVNSSEGGTVIFRNLSVFGQDTWRVSPRLTLTYGLRWELDLPPSTGSGPSLVAVSNFNNPSTIALAPPGTPLWGTTYHNFAPRVGAAYQLSDAKGWETVVRGGFGVFYDLASTEAGDAINGSEYPFGVSILAPTTTFPPNPSQIQPPPITAASLASGFFVAFDPNLKLPYTLQWNLAFEQSMSSNQALSISYIGAAGRRLVEQEFLLPAPNPTFFGLNLVGNATTSDYDALQVQFQRRLSKGLQAVASYSWSHSIDEGSSSSEAGQNIIVFGSNPSANRGNSDFDIRHTFSGALSYNVPEVPAHQLLRAISRDWSIDNIFQARTATAVNVYEQNFIGPNLVYVRPDVVPGEHFYLYGSQYPGGKALNPAAFAAPPTDSNGNLGRNSLRAFGAWQWDFALRRQFNLRDNLHLQFKGEFFNLLNHPNFGPPLGDISQTGRFGLSSQMLGRSLSGGAGSGGLIPLYQIGGPRSVQLALKLQF